MADRGSSVPDLPWYRKLSCQIAQDGQRRGWTRNPGNSARGVPEGLYGPGFIAVPLITSEDGIPG